MGLRLSQAQGDALVRAALGPDWFESDVFAKDDD